jgi:hypothetical protein
MKVPNSKISGQQTQQLYTSASSVNEALTVKNITEQKININNSQNLLLQQKIINPINNVAGEKMRMPEQNFIQRKCAHCEEEEKAQRTPLASFIQKKATENNSAVSDSVSNQIQSTKGNGNAMPDATKSFMENRFTTDFSNVKIHTGNYATQLSNQLNAQAFTIGNDIYFNEGKYQPESTDGKRLLAHELTHTIQQSNYIQRQSGSGAMTRQQFEQTMRNTYGVSTIQNGTVTDQIKSMGLDPKVVTSLPNWQSWNPGAQSDIYKYIIDAFAEFSKTFGGFPPVTELTFYNIYYDIKNGNYVPVKDVGAMFGNTDLSIFSSINTANKGLPFAKSNASGNYPGSPGIVLGYNGNPNAAPIGLPTRQESAMRIIFHELGHGLQVAAMQPAGGIRTTAPPDPDMMKDYIKEIGRYPSTGVDLYDIGVAQVQSAIAANAAPPAQFKITDVNWNDPNWIEQPVSDYMVSGGASEDFAEAVMAFMAKPKLLQTRSPHRYNFLDKRRAKWQSRLATPIAATATSATSQVKKP